VQDRASAHINARKRACVIRERPGDHCSPGMPCAQNGPAGLIPAAHEAPPALATLQIETTPAANTGPATNAGQWQATATETLPPLKVRVP
ncbi:MAG TPA: hypothetical protein VEL76_28110, partial [Gemmataceae bacterium]|nr:hypothetical protein [Gemmataceae bacterium]